VEHKRCVLIFSTPFVERFLILRRNGRDTIERVRRYSRQVLVILVKF